MVVKLADVACSTSKEKTHDDIQQHRCSGAQRSTDKKLRSGEDSKWDGDSFHDYSNTITSPTVIGDIQQLSKKLHTSATTTTI